MTFDVFLNESFVAQIAVLLTAHVPAAEGRIAKDHPGIRMILIDVAKGIPVLGQIPGGDEIDADFLFDGGIIMQGLGYIGYGTPNQDIKRTRVFFLRALDDPF